MKSRNIIRLLLALVMVLSLTACGGSKPVVKTAEGREAVREMVTDFYKDLKTADPIRTTLTMDGTVASVFTKDGDKMCSESSYQDVPYYMFMEDGVKYAIYDGSTAFPDEFMYDMTAGGMELTLAMFVTGILESEDAEDAPLTYKATRTDGSDGSELVYEVTGESEGQSVKLTVAGKADADGKVTEIDYDAASGDQSQTIILRFEYDGVTVTLPEYTIDPGEVLPEFAHVESPFGTIQELIDVLGEDESLSYSVMDNRLYAACRKDGRHYQVSAPLSQEDRAAFDALDIFDDDYEQKVYEIIGKLTIDDCIDITDGILSQEEMNSFVGKTAREMMDAGFEDSGWSAFEDEVYLFLTAEYMEYTVKLTPDESFDAAGEFELEDLLDFPVEKVEFNQATTFFFQ